MELSLHANATTTPKIRGYIQRSKEPVAALAAELGVSETTIYRWRGRATDKTATRIAFRRPTAAIRVPGIVLPGQDGC